MKLVRAGCYGVVGGGSMELAVRLVAWGGGANAFNKIRVKWQIASLRDLGSLRQFV